MQLLALNGVVVIGLGIMLSAAPLGAEESRGPESKPHVQAEGTSGVDMQSRRAQVRTRMEEGQSKLDDLAARMNEATGQDKVDAMAAVLNEMVGQRKALRDRIADRMTSHKSADRYGGDDGSSKMSGKSQ